MREEAANKDKDVLEVRLAGTNGEHEQAEL